MEKITLIKYGEVALRKKNRHIFENMLRDNCKSNLTQIEGTYEVIKEQGRIVVFRTDGMLDFDEVHSALKKVFGISYISNGYCFREKNLEQMIANILCVFQYELSRKNSFRIVTKRADKQFPISSMDVSRKIGAEILHKFPHLSVDLNNAEISITVEIRKLVYCYMHEHKGQGGLPCASSGRGIVLLSGGIDSPVAFYAMARRGMQLSCVYFHSHPYTGERAKQKVMDLVESLSRYVGKITLYIVPFTDLQLYLLKEVPHEKITIFMKRAMLAIAERIAKKEKALALITGDSVGQVASQTLEALYAVSSASTLPILRPLVAWDKQEIVDVAKKIGTFSISSRPYEDCCTVFVPAHPDIKPRRHIIEKKEKDLVLLEELMDLAIQHVDILEIESRQYH